LKEEKIESEMEYIKPSIIVCDSPIKVDDVFKKKGGQYAKYKTVPKWHHYAWDMIK
jgi:hypothetical protein